MAIIFLVLFGTEIKKRAIRGIAEQIPSYECDKDEVCTSCIIEGEVCSCTEHVCQCGNDTVEKGECEMFN